MADVRVIAVVLAAGEGRRMGGPKALLKIGERSFLAHVASCLSRPGVTKVLAVLGHQAARVRAESGLPEDVQVVENDGYAGGMLSSVLCGLSAAEAAGAEAVLLHPVDHPLVATATVDRVIRALEEGARIAVPNWERRRGHPGGFAAAAFPALRAADVRSGARAALLAHPDWIAHVEGDAGCVRGIDTPDDYARWVQPSRQ